MVNTLLCGDCLIIRRIKNGQITLQAIDGRNVCGGVPEHNSNNKVIDGVEINKNGEHIAYHIITEDGKNERIKAKDSKGNIQAWLVYANNSRISQVRGVSAICSIIQKIDQLSKYTENEVVASEVNSKLATVIEHTELSDGKNPLVGRELIKNNGNPIYDPELKEETKAAILRSLDSYKTCQLYIILAHLIHIASIKSILSNVATENTNNRLSIREEVIEELGNSTIERINNGNELTAKNFIKITLDL